MVATVSATACLARPRRLAAAGSVLGADLVVVPLIAILTSGTARFASYVTVAPGLLVRANQPG